MVHKEKVKIFTVFFATCVLMCFIIFVYNRNTNSTNSISHKPATNPTISYWLLLKRKSNVEYLYLGTPGVISQSALIKSFTVKSGIPGERPTPLPTLLGREFWLVTEKLDASQNPETAPYFLTLDIPYTDSWPFGPEPYEECESGQCDWVLPGSFGLHGVNGDLSRISNDNPGSSGCVRHTDADITLLYKLLKPDIEPVRYYIEDV